MSVHTSDSWAAQCLRVNPLAGICSHLSSMEREVEVVGGAPRVTGRGGSGLGDRVVEQEGGVVGSFHFLSKAVKVI